MTPCTKCGRPCTYDNWICDYCKGEEKDPLYDDDDPDDMDWNEEDSDDDFQNDTDDNDHPLNPQ